MKAHRVALLGLGGWVYAGAAAWMSYESMKVGAIVFALMSITCVALMAVSGGRR